LRIILCGFGVVGQSLAKLFDSRAEDLYVQYGIKPRIVGTIDSKGSATESSGLDLNRLVNVKKKSVRAATLRDSFSGDGIDILVINDKGMKESTEKN